MWMINGVAGRVRARIAELKMGVTASEQQEQALEHARHLDADDVGRRADRRRMEREASDGLSATDDPEAL